MEEYNDKADFVCINCTAENEDGAIFCYNCGTELDSNYCTNEFCNRNNGLYIQMPREFCYCDICGHESSYLKNGFIKPQVFDHN